MLISPAFAQSADGAGGLTSLLPFVLIFVVFYFFLIRPQQKRAKEHRNVNRLSRGDKVITSGGLVGKVTKAVDDQETVEVEIAKDVKVNIMRTMIADKQSKNDKPKNAAAAGEPKAKSGLAGLFGGKK